MRHRIAGRQLNRTSEHRLALRRNLAAALFEHETISTTVPKAKDVKPFAEKLITLAKQGTLAARRRATSLLGHNRDILAEEDGEVVKKGTLVGKLFSDIAPRYLERKGGYTRIIQLAKRRVGDNSRLVLLQLVGKETEPVKKSSGKKKSAKKGSKKTEKTQKSKA
jgi:large subunit ribosomal protein L17